VVLHPLVGPLLLALMLFLVFQAVFAWAEAPMGWIEAATAWLGEAVAAQLPQGWLRSLLVDGVIAGRRWGAGVPAADRDPVLLHPGAGGVGLPAAGGLPAGPLMGSVGLSGRSFIPLLSSFACAIPGIMAARTIANPRDRLVTILIAPLMTCSARLPVYALLIGAFVPQREVWGGVELQGLVLFGCTWPASAALAVAWLLKLLTARGQVRTLMMELPPTTGRRLRNIAIGLWQRVKIFLRRVGGIILVLTWRCGSWPAFRRPRRRRHRPGHRVQPGRHAGPGAGAAVRADRLQLADQHRAGARLAAREVAVSALATVYALSATGDDAAGVLAPARWRRTGAWPPRCRCWPGSWPRRCA
jgi:ferrous iron transport protein B